MIAFAAKSARLGDQHAQYGLIPGWGSSQRLPRLIGLRRALDLMYSGKWLTADEALIIRYSRELLEEKQVRDATFEAVRARWGEKGALELTAVMSVYLMNATILRAVGHQPDAGARLLTPRT